MGYILPITPHQSIQYAERELTGAREVNPYRFVPVNKVMNELRYDRQIIRDEEEEKSKKGKKDGEKETSEESQHYSRYVRKHEQQGEALKKINREVTGKGQSFSEFV